jgi:hypothetical protein
MVVIGMLVCGGVVLFAAFLHHPMAKVDGNGRWDDESIASAKAAGTSLVSSLYKYRNDHKRFPETLQELVPAYADAIPSPTAGSGRWEYVCVAHMNEFELSFGDEIQDEYYRYASTRPESGWGLFRAK